jgi:hypothetical protein
MKNVLSARFCSDVVETPIAHVTDKGRDLISFACALRICNALHIPIKVTVSPTCVNRDGSCHCGYNEFRSLSQSMCHNINPVKVAEIATNVISAHHGRAVSQVCNTTFH